MIMKANKQIGFIYKDNESIDKILKDGEVVFERGFLREKTSTTLPITFGGVGKDLKDYKVYGNTVQSKLPSGYTQVDYIESDGNQYINTGVNADSNLSVKMNLSSDYHIQQRHMGAIKNDNGVYTRHHITLNDSTTTNYIASFTGRTNSAQNLLLTIDDNKHYLNLDIYNKKVSVDEETPIDLTLQPFDTELNYWLFARNSNNSTNMSFAIMQIYDCKMFYKGVLVRDFIPCYRNSDNEVGLYDLVNNVFYTNKGTGSFTYGSVAPTPDAPIEIVSVGDLIADTSDVNYGKYKIPVNVRSDNLFKVIAKSSNGITSVINSDGSITYSGTATSTWANITANNYIDIEPGKYTFSIDKPLDYKIIIRLYYEDDTFDYAEIYAGNTKQSFTLNRKVKRYYAYIANYLTVGKEYNETLYIQLVKGPTAPSKYIPYYNETINIYLDEPLRGIGEYSDYIDFINGKVVRQLGEVVFDGSENWVLANIYNNISQFDYTNNLIKNFSQYVNISLFANYFGTTDRWGNSWTKDNTALHRVNSNKIRIQSSNFTTLEDFKTWLSTHNTTVDYVLATPTEESITLPNIPTIDGNNTLNIETEITPSQVYIKYKSNE